MRLRASTTLLPLLPLLPAVLAGQVLQKPLLPGNDGDNDRTSAYIFTSLHGLLRQWPNSYARTGHMIVPATVPAYTLLYHARKTPDLPPSPEWLAFDVEMSNGIMGSWGQCYMLTYTSTRPLNVLYFDGESAALGSNGTLDSQKVFLYGKVIDDEPPHWGTPREPGYGGPGKEPGKKPGGALGGEYTRAYELCKWAKSLGEGVVDGFVRMNAGFELLWCDFSIGLELVANRNVTAPTAGPIITPEPPLTELLGTRSKSDENPPLPADNGDHRPHMPYFPPGAVSRFSSYNRWEWIRSATWHYSETPESRVLLNFCSLETFYDPALTSLQPRPPEKRQHRLKSISPADANFLKARLTKNLQSPTARTCSGVDWRHFAESILERYAGRIKELELLIREEGESDKTVERIWGLTHALVVPFLEYDDEGRGRVEEAAERCRFEYTGKIPAEALSVSEGLLKSSIEDVLGKICNLALGIYSEAEAIVNDDKKTIAEVKTKNKEWRMEVSAFMDWLGWSGWYRCEEKCAWDEVCAIPLWPVLGLGPWTTPGTNYDHWLEHPACINISYTDRDRRDIPSPSPTY